MPLTSIDKLELIVLKKRIEHIYPVQAYTKLARQTYSKINEDAKMICEILDSFNEEGCTEIEALNELEEFLKTRWERVKNDTTLRYDTAFHLPLNQFISKICDIIKSSLGKTRYEIMVPDLENTLDISQESVDDFQLHQLIFCGDVPNNSFLDLSTCFETTLIKDNIFFKMYHNNIAGRPELNTDALNLIKHRDRLSSTFVDSIYQLRQTFSNPETQKGLTVIREMEDLRTFLMEGDSDHNGEEENAGTEVYDGLYNFQIFLESLPDRERNKIMKLRHFNECHAVQDFQTLWNELTYNDANKSEILNDDAELTFSRCAYLKGQDLEEIIKENRDRLLDPCTAALIHSVSQYLTAFTDGNNCISNIISNFIERNHEPIKLAVQNLCSDLTDQNRFLIEVSLRSCIHYHEFQLLIEILQQLNFSSKFLTARLLKDLIILVPSIYIQEIVPFIDIERPIDGQFDFAFLSARTIRIDIIQILSQQHPNLANVSKVIDSSRPSYCPTLLEYAIDLESPEMVDALLHSLTRISWEFFKSLITRALIANDSMTVLVLNNFIASRRYLFEGVNESLSKRVDDFNRYVDDCIRRNDTILLSALSSFCSKSLLSELLIKTVIAGKINLLTHLLQGNFHRQLPGSLRFHNDHSAGRCIISSIAAALNISKSAFLCQIADDIRTNIAEYSEYDVELDSFLSQLNELNEISHSDLEDILSIVVRRQIFILSPYQDAIIAGEQFEANCDNQPIFLYAFLGSYYPLHLTASNKLDEVLKLSQQNPNISIMNEIISHQVTKKEESIVLHAIEKSPDPYSMVRCLLAHNLDPNQPVRESEINLKPLIFYPIIQAAKLNLRRVVNLLLAYDANVNVRDRYNKTYLEYLAEHPDPEGEALNFNVSEDPLLTCVI